jgi:hypothetical protein
MNTDRIFGLLTIGDNYEIIGTANDEDILYSSDYDLQEYWKGGIEGINYITKVFKDKFREAIGEPQIYITDFKCGEIRGEPIRWNKKAIKSGMVRLYSRKVKFVEALQMKSVIKLDLVVNIHGLYEEYSCNYYFNFGGITNYEKEPKSEIIKSLKEDIREYYKEGKSFKALRRLYSLVKLTEDAPSVKKALQEYFNSPIGLINRCKNQIEILVLMLEQKFSKPKRTDLVRNLECGKEILPDFGLTKEILKTISLIQKLKMGEMKKGLDYLLDFFVRIVDEKTRMWIAENKNISYYIK